MADDKSQAFSRAIGHKKAVSERDVSEIGAELIKIWRS